MKALDRVKESIRRERARRPWLDHAARAYDRNSEVLGGQLAAAVTYFGFLSFFPLLALSFALVGYVSDVWPQAQDGVTEAVESAFPSLVGSGEGQINIQDVIAAKEGAGLIGLLGLLYAGLGWLDALRDSMRRVFGTEDVEIGLVKKKVVDVAVLAALGTSLLASLAVSSVATALTAYLLELVDLDGSLVATALLKALSVALALAVDVVIFSILISRLSGARLPWRQVRSAALVAAVGFEVLKLFGTFLIANTTSNPLYATFGVVVGLLVWINLNSRLLVFSAAWAATSPYSLHPAGIGDSGAGRATALVAGTEPVLAVAPGDYEAVPLEADEVMADGSGSRSGRWRGPALAAGLGAAAAALATRRRSRG